jgi:hypothetical protein
VRSRRRFRDRATRFRMKRFARAERNTIHLVEDFGRLRRQCFRDALEPSSSEN